MKRIKKKKSWVHFRFVVYTKYFQLHSSYFFFPTQMKQQLRVISASPTCLLVGEVILTPQPKPRKVSICFVSVWNVRKCEVIHSGPKKKISSRGKIMKLIKTGRTMNSLPPWRYPNNLRTLLEKWTSCSENRKEQQDINQIKISWDCALENHTACTEICSCSSLQSWLTPGILRDTKTPMCPEPLQVLLARAQGGHLIKKWILTGEKEISHTLYFTRNSNGISTWIWDETQHQERYCGTFAVLRLQKPFVSMRFKGTQNGLQSDEQ